jgi:CheY-like chemotaxis protein
LSLRGFGSLVVDGRACRALVVDDNAINRKILQVTLTGADAVVIEAENGQVACEIFARDSFDVVFMDIEMPVVNGYTATRVIRAFEAERGLVRTPIIMVSAFVSPSDIEEAIAAGAEYRGAARGHPRCAGRLAGETGGRVCFLLRLASTGALATTPLCSHPLPDHMCLAGRPPKGRSRSRR